jgi:glycosyltransferase involved in cell wall biosynthesis
VCPPSTRIQRALQGLSAVGATDLVHGLDADVPLRRRAPTVATVHDLAVFDIPWAGDRVRNAGERLLLAHSVRSADAIIAVSHFTAERISTRWRRHAVVVHEAPGPDMYPASAEEIESCRSRYRLPERFVLYVGNFGPRKGLEVLAEACRTADLTLVVAGGHLGRRAPVEAVALGYVPAVDLRALYGAATVFAYPSRYEGFGLSPLEAMACGVPVVASRIAPLVEVLGDAARLVPADRPDAWSGALEELFADADARAALAAAGCRRAAQFSWADAARSTVDVYAELGVR